MMPIRTEVEFTLPKGFLDDQGTLHRNGVMRLATAADEILPLKEASVQKNPAYLTVILLSRVVVQLGDLSLITPATIERMFAADVSYLQDLYNELNDASPHALKVTCPNCDADFDVERPSSGES
jgi:Zn finger protein HypA/HybF involved in hydrogenase expression